jgi:hypothetical protein
MRKASTPHLSRLLLTGILYVTVCAGLRAQPGNYVRNYTNGRTYQQSSVLAGVRPVRTVRTYYPNGQLMREENFIFGRRNGMTRLYDSLGRLEKAFDCSDDYILSYEAYHNGTLYTKISQDRSVVINKGRRVNTRWGTYYETISGRTVVAYSPRALIDRMSKYLVPESVTQIMEDLNNAFGAKGGQPGQDMFTCGGGTSVFDDRNISVASATQDMSRPSGQRNGTFQTFQSIMGQQVNQCASNARGRASVGGGDPQRQQRISRARSAAQGMIAGCRSKGGDIVRMAGAGESYGFRSLQVINQIETAATAVTESGSAVLVESGTTFAGETTKDVLVAQATEGAAIRSGVGAAARGFVLVEVLAVPAMVATVAAASWTLGTLINNTLINNWWGDKAADMVDANNEELQRQEAEAKKAHEAAEKKRKDAEAAKRASEGGNPPPAQNPPPANPPNPPANPPTTPPNTGGGKKPGMPGPDTEGTGNACDRMQSFVNRCERNQWQSYECENFIRTVNNCAGDITVAMPTPDGDIWSLGCGTDTSRARQDAARLRCQQLGLIAMPRPGGGNICGTGNKNIDMTGLGEPDPRVINPTRGDFRSAGMVRASNIREVGLADVKSVMSSGKPALVVFMDPDCGSCQTMANTIQSPATQAALAGYDVVMVDVGKNPKAFSDYRVGFVPFYFTVKNGKPSEVTGGAMDEKQFNRYMSNNK